MAISNTGKVPVFADQYWNTKKTSDFYVAGKFTDGLLRGAEVDFHGGTGAAIATVFQMKTTARIGDKDISRSWGHAAGQPIPTSDHIVTSSFGPINAFAIVPVTYTISRQRAAKWVILDETLQFFKGDFGFISLMVIDKAISYWKHAALYKDIDSYVLFAMMCGRMTGKYVQASDGVFTQDGSWIEQQGVFNSGFIAPSFAPIQGIELDTTINPRGSLYSLLSRVEAIWNYLNVDSFVGNTGSGQSTNESHLPSNVAGFKKNTTILVDSLAFEAFRDESQTALSSLMDLKALLANSPATTGDFPNILGFPIRFANINDRLPSLVVDDVTLQVDPIESAGCLAAGYTPPTGFSIRKPLGVIVNSGAGQYYEFFNRMSVKRPHQNYNDTQVTDIAFEIFYDVVVTQQYSVGIMPIFNNADSGKAIAMTDLSDVIFGKDIFIDDTLEFDMLMNDTFAQPNKGRGANVTAPNAANIAAAGALVASDDLVSYNAAGEPGALVNPVDKTTLK